MSNLVKSPKEEERFKRLSFLGFTIGGVLASSWLTPFLGLPLIGYGVYQGVKWFQHRAKYGMRF